MTDVSLITLYITIAVLATMDICIFTFACAIWWLYINDKKEHNKFKFVVTGLVHDLRVTLEQVAMRLR